MIRLLRTDIAASLRRLAFTLASALAFLAALGFLTAAGWQALYTWKGAAVASLSVGLVYLIAGLVLVLAGRKRAVEPAPSSSDLDILERVVAAFLRGFEAGKRGRQSAGDDKGVTDRPARERGATPETSPK